MTAILTLLGLSFEGFGILARIKAALLWLGLSAVLVSAAAGYGVWKGYQWRGHIEAAAAAAKQAEIAAEDAAARRAEEDKQRREIEDWAAREGARDAMESDLLAAESDDGRATGLSAGWLRSLERLR